MKPLVLLGTILLSSGGRLHSVHPGSHHVIFNDLNFHSVGSLLKWGRCVRELSLTPYETISVATFIHATLDG